MKNLGEETKIFAKWFAKAAKQSIGTQISNKLNTKIEVYLNAGGWTDGRTDFGIVSENQIALCSWRAPLPKKIHNRHWKAGPNVQEQAAAIDPQNPIGRLIAFPTTPGGQGRVHVFSSYKTPGTKSNGDPLVSFTEKNELIIFLPDMHMHLFRDTPPDGFSRWEETPTRYEMSIEWLFDHMADDEVPDDGLSSEIVVEDRIKDRMPKDTATAKWWRRSQVEDLKNLLDFCDRFSESSGVKLKIVQLGDLVDVWHTQLICLEAHHFMYNQKQKAKKEKEQKTGWRIEYREDCALEFPDFALVQSVKLVELPENWQQSRAFNKETKALGERHVCWDWEDTTPKSVNAFDALVMFLYAFGRRPAFAKDGKKWTELYKTCKIPKRLLNVTIDDYTSWKSVYKTICDQYPELKYHWAKFVAVQGNHDMFVDHPYLKFRYKYAWPWPSVKKQNVFSSMTNPERQQVAQTADQYEIRLFQKGFTLDRTKLVPVPKYSKKRSFKSDHVYWVNREDDEKSGPTADRLEDTKTLAEDERDGTLNDLEQRTNHGSLMGKGDCIWLEHGHAFDPYNNKHSFFREDLAYGRIGGPVVKGATGKAIRGGFTGTAIGIGMKFADYDSCKDTGPVPDRKLIIFANNLAGASAMERCQRILNKKGKEKGIRLVVLAHTHCPWLVDQPRERSTFHTRPYLWKSLVKRGVHTVVGAEREWK